MFTVPRFLLLSSRTLLKIIREVTKGIYSTVLKVCNEIEFTLRNGENSYFSQNVRRSGMYSFKNSLLSTTQTYKLQNQAVSIGNTSESLRSTQNVKCASNTKIFVKVSDGSSLQMYTLYRKIKSQLNESNCSKKETSEWDLLSMPSQFVKHNHKIQSFPSDTAALRQKKSVDTTLRNRAIESAYIHEHTTIQSSEPHFKKQENYPDLHKIKNAIHATYVTDDKLHQSERDYHNEESNGNESEHHGDVGETNIEEAKVSYQMDDGSFRSCSLMDQAAIKERKNGSEGNLVCLKFQGEEVRLDTDSNEGGEIFNCSQAAHLENSITNCSDSPIKDEMLNDDISNACKVKAVQEAEKVVEDIQHGKNSTEKACLSTSTSTNKFVLVSSSPESLQLQLKSGKGAFSRFLVELEPVIAEVEHAILVLCKRWHDSPLTLLSNLLQAIYSSFAILSEKSLQLKMPYHSFVTLYVNDMISIIEEIQDTNVSVRIQNSLEHSSFIDDIRLRLMKKREFLFSDGEEVFNGEKEPIRKNKISRKRKLKNKRKW